MENLSFTQIKSLHEKLIFQYLLLIDHVREKYKYGYLRILVEDHIKKRLLELSTDYRLIGSNPKIEDSMIIDWYHQTSENCKNRAENLITAGELLVKPLKFIGVFWKVIIKVVLFLSGAATIGFIPALSKSLNQGKLVPMGQENTMDLPNKIIEINISDPAVIINLVTFVICFIVLIFGFRFLDAIGAKNKLFTNQIRTIPPAHPDNLENVKSLENELFLLIGKSKKVDVPIDLIFTVITQLTLTYLLSLVLMEEYTTLAVSVAFVGSFFVLYEITKWKDRLRILLV